MPENSTKVRVSRENWHRLNRLKRPGDTFDDVIDKLVEDFDGSE